MQTRILLATGAALIALTAVGGAKAQGGTDHEGATSPPSRELEESRAGQYEGMTLNTGPTGVLQSLVRVPVSRLSVNPRLMQKTAYDFLTDFSMMGMIESAATDAVFVEDLIAPAELTALFDQQRSRAASSGREVGAGVILRIAMADASSVDVAVGLDSPLGKYMPGSARTAGGQLIPDRLEQVRGTWTDEGGDDLGSLADHFAALGATIVPADAPSGAPDSIACTLSAASHVCELENRTR